MKHWSRDDITCKWTEFSRSFSLKLAAAGVPAIIQTTYNRNLSAVYWESVSNCIRHWIYDQKTGQWELSVPMNPEQGGPTKVWGYPGHIQSNINSPGSFEVVVRGMDARLHHWRRGGLRDPETGYEGDG